MTIGQGPDAFRPVPRGHAADHVFAQLAATILRGDPAAGAALPPERVLAERFHASRIIVRQAVHRLAEVGLVRVRQGGATIVLGLADATDLRVLELYYRYGPTEPGDLRDLTERQALQGLGIVSVASRRADVQALEAAAAIVEEWARSDDLERDFLEFEERYWTALARAGGNRIYVLETAWWFRLLRERPDVQHLRLATAALRVRFFRELVRRLIAKEEPTRFYLDMTAPFLAALVQHPHEEVPR